MFQGNPTRADEREQKKKEKQDELGVCRIRREEENQSSETLGSGFVVKDLPIVQAIDCQQYCLISSNKVFPNDFNIKSYYLDFKKLNKQELKTIKLEHIASSTKVNRTLFPGLVVIPVHPSSKCSKKESIFTYRPFKAVNERRRPNQDLRCHFIDDQQPIFSVKRPTLRQSETNPVQYQLVETLEIDHYTTYDEVTRKGDRKPYGGAILKYVDSEYVVVGAMAFTDDDHRDISPVFFCPSSGEKQNVPDPANPDEVVNPNPSKEAARFKDTVPGLEHLNQERNGAVDGKIETPNLEATVSATAATPKESLQPDKTNIERLTINSTQEEVKNTVDAGATETAQQPTPAANSYDRHFVSDLEKYSIQEKLAPYLDHTSHRVIKIWEHLACTKEVNAPLETRLRCRLNNQHSQTQMLIDFIAVDPEMTQKTVKDLIAALKAIGRNDVVEIITAKYLENSTKTISDFKSSESEMIDKMATKLDQQSRVTGNWRKLGGQFKVPVEKLKEIEYGPFNPALVLMEYLYSRQKDLTVRKFYDVLVENKLERGDVLEKLKPFLDEDGEEPMEKVIALESDVMRSLCVDLNGPNRVLKNWRHLASAFKVPRTIYNDFNPNKPLSPTKLLFEWIFANRRDLTVGQLCTALKSIERNDVVRELRKYLEEQYAGQE